MRFGCATGVILVSRDWKEADLFRQIPLITEPGEIICQRVNYAFSRARVRLCVYVFHFLYHVESCPDSFSFHSYILNSPDSFQFYSRSYEQYKELIKHKIFDEITYVF